MVSLLISLDYTPAAPHGKTIYDAYPQQGGQCDVLLCYGVMTTASLEKRIDPAALSLITFVRLNELTLLSSRASSTPGSHDYNDRDDGNDHERNVLVELRRKQRLCSEGGACFEVQTSFNNWDYQIEIKKAGNFKTAIEY